ncbi:MAG: exonuclease domain-containing protein [Rhodospirillales bacterium]
MDHIARVRTMSIRRLSAAALAIVGAGGVAAVVAAAAVGWIWPGAGFTLLAVLTWWQLDRLLSARERDGRALPARPELYDFDKLNPPMHVEELGGKTLRQMTYVVFDTETTGLKPTAGDEIISIAGVRVVDGEIDEDRPFSRLVDPGMPIPKESIRFHGITDDMVKGEAPVTDVIRDFKDWVGDAVLVAHNAAFDMKFLKLKEEASGVRFDNLVLDTLLLSVFADQDSKNHSLDAMAERMGIDIEGRHTALGDSIATAKVFVRLLEMLEARGVTTLRHAIKGSVKVEDILALDLDF